MSKFLNEIQAANLTYAEGSGDEASLSTLSAHRFSILTCMEAWLDPARFAGATQYQGHVIRNAGGRATDDAIRSLVLSYRLLDAREWFVIHHTDCDLRVFNNPAKHGFLANRPASTGSRRKRTVPIGQRRLGDGLDVDEPKPGDNPASVVAEVRRIRRHPLVPTDVTIYGYLFDVRSGRLREVPEATTLGASGKLAGLAAFSPGRGLRATRRGWGGSRRDEQLTNVI